MDIELTYPDNLAIVTNAAPNSLPAASATMMTSVQDALLQRQVHTYKWANATEREEEADMTVGDLGDQGDIGAVWRYNGDEWRILISSSAEYPAGFIGLDVADGVLSSTYTQVGDNVFVNGSLEWGQSTSISGPVYVSLPVDENSALYKGAGSQKYVGGCQLLDIESEFGVLGVPGFLYINSLQSGFAQFQRNAVSGGNVVQFSIQGDQPFVWGPGDIMSWSFSYVRE